MDSELMEDDDSFRFPFYDKHPYASIFHFPGPDWQIEAVWDDGYYQAAQRLIEGVASGEYLPAFEGVAGLYLFRHYLELALKFIIFHSRWLKDTHTNAQFKGIESVKKTHSLKQLWVLAKAECQRLLPMQERNAVDIDFVEKCVEEFDSVDPDGERFRYHGPKLGVEKDQQRRAALAHTMGLYIDFKKLAHLIRHVHDVLNHLDTYMIETYGQNEEWESILGSF